jgi:hypothetical protein
MLAKVWDAWARSCRAGAQFLGLNLQPVARVSIPADDGWAFWVEQLVKQERRVGSGIAARIEIDRARENIRPFACHGSHESAPTRIGVEQRFAFARDWLGANSEATSRTGRHQQTTRAAREGSLHDRERARQYGWSVRIGRSQIDQPVDRAAGIVSDRNLRDVGAALAQQYREHRTDPAAISDEHETMIAQPIEWHNCVRWIDRPWRDTPTSEGRAGSNRGRFRGAVRRRSARERRRGRPINDPSDDRL